MTERVDGLFSRDKAMSGMKAAIEAMEMQGLNVLECLKAAEWIRGGCISVLEQGASSEAVKKAVPIVNAVAGTHERPE